MQSKKIAVDIHYPILDCDQPGWSKWPMRIDHKSKLKISRQSVKEIVSIPCFPLMNETEINYVCEALDEWGSS
jgi:dTDP-4-amino-4,6-dideoxygalactose transaminase